MDDRMHRPFDEHSALHDLEALMLGLQEVSPDARAKLEALALEKKKLEHKNRQSVESLQEGLDWLRLSVKYLMFDLEATRRENVCLREMLLDNREEGGTA